LRTMQQKRSGDESLGGVKSLLTSRRAFLSAAFASFAAGQTDGPHPNVILIVAGQWRAQAVPWAGDPNLKIPNVEVPNLTGFGQQSLTFSRAYSCYPSPNPARTAILSGRFPHAPAGPRISALFGLAGYRTATFTTLQVDDLVSFVRSRPPFFAYWQMAEPGGFTRRLDSSTLQLRPNVPAALEARARERLGEFYGRVPAWDQEIGILLAALERADLKDTIVVFTSECGEQMGSQGLMMGDVAFEESVRIPLAIRHPRLWPEGAETSVLVSQADLVPTLLGLCGFLAPAGVQGTNLTRAITEDKGERPDAVYAEGQIGQKSEWRMLVHGYDKLVTDNEGSVTRLYNLADDPYETNNLASVSSEQLKRDALVATRQLWTRKLEDGVDPSGLKIRRD
jgi:arylsulfatase A-like enzyme